jgi:ABC-type transport system substrate-binding protein
MLEDVGFEVDLTILDNATYREKIMRPGNNREAYIVTTGKGPTILLTQYSCSWTGVNYVCREDLDALNEAIFTEVDTEKRLAMWEEWWEIFLDESIDVTLYEINRFMGANEDLQMVPRADGWITPRDWELTAE